MNWAQNILDDENVFPNKIGTDDRLSDSVTPNLIVTSGIPFPRNFRDTVRTIVRRLFRVYAHIYSNHFDQICALGIEGIFQSLSSACEGIDSVASNSSTSEYQLSSLFLVHQRSNFSVPLGWPSLTALTQFDLVEKKELAPLDELNDAILAEDKTR